MRLIPVLGETKYRSWDGGVIDFRTLDIPGFIEGFLDDYEPHPSVEEWLDRAASILADPAALTREGYDCLAFETVGVLAEAVTLLEEQGEDPAIAAMFQDFAVTEPVWN